MPPIVQLHSASRVGALFNRFLGRSRLGILVASFFVIAANVFCAPADEFFETRIRPVLASECYECHGPEKQKGGLRLDYRDAARKGGDTGPAVVPNDPAKSLLI